MVELKKDDPGSASYDAWGLSAFDASLDRLDAMIKNVAFYDRGSPCSSPIVSRGDSSASWRPLGALVRPLFVLFALVCLCTRVSAHPHVFVTVQSDIVFGPGKKIVAVRQNWTFDEMYTAFAITGFGKDSDAPSREELQVIAQQNMEDMADYAYFTVLKIGAAKASFDKPVDYSADLAKTKDDYSLQLHFTLPLRVPAAPETFMTLQVYDPSYFRVFRLRQAERRFVFWRRRRLHNESHETKAAQCERPGLPYGVFLQQFAARRGFRNQTRRDRCFVVPIRAPARRAL